MGVAHCLGQLLRRRQEEAADALPPHGLADGHVGQVGVLLRRQWGHLRRSSCAQTNFKYLGFGKAKAWSNRWERFNSLKLPHTMYYCQAPSTQDPPASTLHHRPSTYRGRVQR